MTNDKLLKALPMYLNHELKVYSKFHDRIWTMTADISNQLFIGINRITAKDSDVKPILYDLDLTKPIWFEGEKFVPATIYPMPPQNDVRWKAPKQFEYTIIEKLLEWKIDVFGLIPSGGAISVDSLKENCYK